MRYSDHLYLFELNDVSLTVTPANLANSAENGGLRVDGRDTCTQPIPVGILSSTAGLIKFNWIPRHAAGDFWDFQGEALTYLLQIEGGGAVEIIILAISGTLLQVQFNDGGGAHNSAFNAAGIIQAGTEYQVKIKYTASQMQLLIDGVVRATITTPIDFGNTWDIQRAASWGHYPGPLRHFDSVFKAP